MNDAPIDLKFIAQRLLIQDVKNEFAPGNCKVPLMNFVERLQSERDALLAMLKKADRAGWGDYSWVDEARVLIADVEGK